MRSFPGSTISVVEILTLARVRLFTASLRGKNERVARNERKPVVSNFMILGQPVTPEVRSNTQI